MTILIDTIRIAGFRGIQNIEMSLPRVAVLIGPNNSGKTSLLKALQLAIGDYSRALSEEDFHIGSDGKQATEILIDIRIIPVNAQGQRAVNFETKWQAEFGDKIMAEASGNQFVALRTRAQPNLLKGNFETKRCTLGKWPNSATWNKEQIKETNLNNRFECLLLFAVDAQRDIHNELREKTSFVGRVLSGIKYNEMDVVALEEMIAEVNAEAINKSDELKSIKRYLEQLNRSFQGTGNAEITPLPKKIRDLSKHVSVHFGENATNSFSMEYHGMGTRSWASLLTVKAFADILITQYENEAKPFFPILAAEEPEAHLHPNAQKTLYQQLAESKGQVIVSTHSPALAAIANGESLRGLKRDGGNVKILKLPAMIPEDQRRLHREILHSRGEIIFSKAIVLCEGETEEQALPVLFEKYFGSQSFTMGINFVGVGGAGKKYLPFFMFAKNFDIPIFVFSDGEENIVGELKKNYDSVFGVTDVKNCPYITILDNMDFEEYLISLNLLNVLEDAITDLDGPTAIVDWKTRRQGSLLKKDKTQATPCPTCNQIIGIDVYRDYSPPNGHKMAIREILDSSKPKYAPAIAEKLCNLDIALFPPKVIAFFEKIKTGLAI